MEFEDLLKKEQPAVERFVRFRVSARADADDILQETYLAAYQKFPQLKNKASFKAWLVSIARNKCNDYFRKKAVEYEIPMDEAAERELSDSRYGISAVTAVRETLDLLGSRDQQILYLYFWKELPQAEIAARLNIPLGTVKSRLHTAKRNFKNTYPYPPAPLKGEQTMKKLPELLPRYQIEASGQAPFPVKWEELMGWFLIPKPGAKLSWGMYDAPSRQRDHAYEMQVTGKARVHGVEGVEITAREAPYTGKPDTIERTFVAQLTDTHCRYLAALRLEGDIRDYITFLDADEFMPTWGFGEDNCGWATDLSRKGCIRRDGATVTSAPGNFSWMS